MPSFPSFRRKRSDNSNDLAFIAREREDVFLNPYTTRLKKFEDIARVSPYHLINTVMHDPIAFRLTYRTAEDSINGWFSIVDRKNKVIKNEEDIQDQLQGYRAKDVIRLATTYELIFGRSWLTKLDDVYHAISPTNLQLYNTDSFDEVGKNTKISVNYQFRTQNAGVEYEPVSPDNYFFHRTRPYDLTSQGLSILEVCYEDMHWGSNIRRDTAERLRKYANFVHIQVAQSDDTVLKKYKARYGDFNKLDEIWSDEKMTIAMHGLQGAAMNPEYYHKPFIQQVSIATGIPVSILLGMESGQLKSGQINLSSYYSVVSNTQFGITPCVEWLVDKIEPGTMKKNYIKFNLEYAYSDSDRAAINEMKVNQAVMLRPHISDKAFARLLAPIGITEEDIEEQEIEESFDPSGFGGDKWGKIGNEGMNPIEADQGRKFGEKKSKDVRSNI